MKILVKLSDGKTYEGIVNDNTKNMTFSIADRSGRIIDQLPGYKTVEVMTNVGLIAYAISLEHFNLADAGVLLEFTHGKITVSGNIPSPSVRYEIVSIVETGEEFGNVLVRFRDLKTTVIDSVCLNTFRKTLTDQYDHFFGKGYWIDDRVPITWKIRATRYYSVTVEEVVKASSYEEAQAMMEKKLADSGLINRLRFDHDDMDYDTKVFRGEINKIAGVN
ncbi:MAG: hypothetical protein HPY53_01505 [Brevinematales bacterium]|nr:hypothetical protein [Brevinematales bacterium]